MKYTTKQLEEEVDKAGTYFQGIYLEWVNDWVTLTEFAESHNFTEEQARQLIHLGRKVHANLTSK